MATIVDAPTREALAAVDPDFPVPDDYTGNTDNRDWAAFIISMVNRHGYTFEEAVAPIKVRKARPNMEDTFHAYAEKFNLQNVEALSVLPQKIENLHSSAGLYYTLRAADLFEGQTDAIATVLPLLYGRADKAGQNENGIIPLSELQKFFSLYSSLREEGIIRPFQDVFLYSIHWSTSDFITLLAEEVDLQASLKLQISGIHGAEEILRMFRTLPKELLDSILDESE